MYIFYHIAYIFFSVKYPFIPSCIFNTYLIIINLMSSFLYSVI